MGKTSKKDPMQFTIKFNGSMPMHQQAADFLNKCGRSKATVIALAINSYLGSPDKFPGLLPDQMGKVLESGDAGTVSQSPGPIPATETHPIPDGVYTAGEAEDGGHRDRGRPDDMLDGLSDSDLSAIMESLNFFDDIDEEDDW